MARSRSPPRRAPVLVSALVACALAALPLGGLALRHLTQDTSAVPQACISAGLGLQTSCG
jgi:hypothetical protein